MRKPKRHLTESERKVVRFQYFVGRQTQAAIARAWGLHKSSVCRIIKLTPDGEKR